MADRLILETSFLVDLERELIDGSEGPAHAFLDSHPDASLHITFTIAGELAAGPRLGDRERWHRLVEPFVVLESSPEVAWRYGRLYRYLRANGLSIGTNDLWIAATALANDMPVVTCNQRHFRRVPELGVLTYTETP